MIKKAAQQTIQIELEELGKLAGRIDDEFEAAVRRMLDCRGHVVVTGVGKSGHIGRKIAASLASTGTPSFFMHPAEAFHGDLGMVTGEDVVLAISNSGESAEVVRILPAVRRIGASVVAMCGRRDSALGRGCDAFINIGVAREAGPLGLAPTSSTTATLVMGDAVTVALLSARGFTAQDFALCHPGGTLGRRLLLTVADVMHAGERNPVVHEGKPVREALFVMTGKGLGAASVVDGQGNFVGLVTDGAIRRCLARGSSFLDSPVGDIMETSPITIARGQLATDALHAMKGHQPRPVTVLPVVEGNRPVGMVHLTDLMGQGIL